MSTALAPTVIVSTALVSTEIDEARTEIARLRAQVVRLQKFAFRDLLALTREELDDAVNALPHSSMSILRRFLSRDTTASTTSAGTGSVDAVEPSAPTDEQRCHAWQQTAGTLARIPVTPTAAPSDLSAVTA